MKASVALFAAFGTLFGVAACGGGTSQKVAVQPGLLSTAYHKTQAAHSSALVMDLQITPATGSTSSVTVNGAMQWNPLLGSITENIALANQQLTMEARLIGSAIYLKLPDQYASQMGGKPWVKADLSSLVGNGGLNSYDPTQILSLLQSQTDSITRVGTETVDGQKTTHYNAVLDLNKSNGSPALKQLLTKLEPMLGGSTLPIDVWIDSSGKLVQTKLTMILKAPPAGAPSAENAAFPIRESMTERLSNYGIPVSVAAPPAGQVSPLDLTQILQQSGL